MQPIAESELIIDTRGAIYHLNAKPGEIADTIITVGDPARVKQVSKYFDNVEPELRHREFVTHTGWIGKKRLSVVSTGIGTDNVDIVLNELDALVNIDFDLRSVQKEFTALTIIRVGTSGSLQADITVDSFVASTHGLGIDNLLNYYQHTNNDEEKTLIQQFVAHTQLETGFSRPYIASASASVLKHFVEGFHHAVDRRDVVGARRGRRDADALREPRRRRGLARGGGRERRPLRERRGRGEHGGGKRGGKTEDETHGPSLSWFSGRDSGLRSRGGARSRGR